MLDNRQKELIHFLTHIRDFMSLLFSRFMANNGLQNAASMTYTTLLSLVPLMAVLIAIFSMLSISDNINKAIQGFVFENFVPASGDVLQSYLEEFSGKAAKMTGTSFIFLILVAIMLMASIDRAFNTIWRVKKKRGLMKMLMVYWSVISLGPLLMAASIAVTSYIISHPFLNQANAEMEAVLPKVLIFMPVIVSTFAFSILYAIVPNRSVPLRHALAGGFVAALLFEIAKRGFGFYVTNFPTYEAIYGALATVPIFLVWLYLSWVVTILGAEFTYCLSIYKRQKKQLAWHGDQLIDVMELLGLLWKAQLNGNAMKLEHITDEISGYTEEQMENLLIRMLKARLVHHTSDDKWALGRDLGSITVDQLYHMHPLLLPDAEKINSYDGVAAQAVRDLMLQVEGSAAQHMQLSLEQLFGSERQAIAQTEV